MHSEAHDTADLLRQLLDDLERQKTNEEEEESVQLLRSVTDQTAGTDTASATKSASPTAWSDADWGYHGW